VTVATPAACQPIISSMGPEYMTEALRGTADGLDPDEVDRVIEMARDVLAIGPGLGPAPGRASSFGSSSIARRCRW